MTCLTKGCGVACGLTLTSMLMFSFLFGGILLAITSLTPVVGLIAYVAA